MPCTSKVATYHPWFFLGFLPWIRVHALTSYALPAPGVFSLKFCIFKGNIVIPIHISIQSYILKITTEVIDTSRCWIYINGTTTHGSIIVVVLGCCLFISYSYFQIESGTKQIFECGAWKNLWSSGKVLGILCKDIKFLLLIKNTLQEVKVVGNMLSIIQPLVIMIHFTSDVFYLKMIDMYEIVSLKKMNENIVV